MMNDKPKSALRLEPQHFEEFAEQLAQGLPFVLTDGTRRIELVPNKERVQ
jgi:hypothetical protein